VVGGVVVMTVCVVASAGVIAVVVGDVVVMTVSVSFSHKRGYFDRGRGCSISGSCYGRRRNVVDSRR
jgi:hypothetical protein